MVTAPSERMSYEEYLQWKQAESLIQRGKAGAARGDPELFGKVQYLLEGRERMSLIEGRMKEQESSYPSVPEGYQGVSTAEGVKFEKIPGRKAPSPNTDIFGIQRPESETSFSIPQVSPSQETKKPQVSMMPQTPRSETIMQEPPPIPAEAYGPHLLTVESVTVPSWQKQPLKRFEFELSGMEEYAYQRTGIARREGLGFGIGAVKGIAGIASMVVHPIESAKGFGYAVINPKETISGVSTKLETKPGLFFGEIIGPLALTTLGTYGLAKYSPKITGYVRTINSKEISQESIMDLKVITGEKTFPTAPQKLHYELFMENKYKLPTTTEPKGTLGVWHAAPSPFSKKSVTKAGSSEFPGLYTAPSLSSYFLKIQQQEFSYFGWGFPKLFPKPTAIRIYPKGIVKGVKGRLGYAEIPGIKSEIEAVIPPETPLSRVGSEYYVKWEGTRVPIHRYTTDMDLSRTKLKKPPKTSTYGQITKSYGYSETIPLTTPYHYGITGISSIRSVIYKPMNGISRMSYGAYSNSFKGVTRLNYNYYPKYSGSYKLNYGAGYPKIPSVGYTPYSSYSYPSKPSSIPSIPVITGYPKKPGDKTSNFLFGNFRPGKERKPSVEMFKRPFVYQPGLAALGFRGTGFEKYFKSAKIPGLSWTGITTRPIITGKRRKKKR